MLPETLLSMLTNPDRLKCHSSISSSKYPSSFLQPSLKPPEVRHKPINVVPSSNCREVTSQIDCFLSFIYTSNHSLSAFNPFQPRFALSNSSRLPQLIFPYPPLCKFKSDKPHKFRLKCVTLVNDDEREARQSTNVITLIEEI